MPTPRRSSASVLVLLAAQAVPLLVVAQAAPAPASAQTVPTPEEHFGFAMGTDKRLARWDEILAYFTKVADGSGRVRVDTLGPTTLGNPFVVVTLSSPQNLSRLEAIRAESARIAEGRIERSEAERIAADLPATVVVNHNIHSTEIGASQTSVDLVHRLATAEDPVTRTIVENVVTVLIPSANPDGQIMVTDWYRRNVGTDFEQARMPWLYHPYAGHDNNRDFFQANLVETRYWMEVMFRTAYPQVYLDQHQMGTNGPRIFVPPYPDPMNPDVHPLQWQELKFMGGRIVADLQAAGKQGVITNALYRIWGQEGALTGRYHNIVALLTETASANVASPDTVTRADLERSANRARDIDEYGFSMDFVSPWWGGEWTLGDIVEYQTIAAVSLLEQTARFRERYVLGRWQMAAETLERAEREGPWAYVIPADQADPANAADLVRRLALQGIEVHRADAAFAAVPSEGMRVPGEPVLPVADATAGEAGAAVASDTAAREAGDTAGARADAADAAADSAPDTAGAEADTAITRLAAPPEPRTFPAGSWVVLGAQPARAAVLDLLQPVARRLQREYPGGPFLRSYDAAAYTMPLQMGVEAARVDRPVDVPLTRVEGVRPEAPPLPRARRWYALPTSANRSFQAANRLLAEGVSVSRTPGHFLVPAGDARVGELLEAMRTELALHVEADPRGAEGGTPLRTTRIGLYQGWAASMDEGWTRFLLEDYDFDVSVLSNDDVRSDDLASDYDVVILPSEISFDRLLEGADEDDAPPDYVGGIGEKGVESLRRFVRRGGTLVTLDRGDEVVLRRFEVPVEDALQGVSDRDFFAPASLFRMELETDHPLASGMPGEVAGKWAGGRAYAPSGWSGEAGPVRVVARWASDPARLLMSGLVAGPEHLAGKAAILDVGYGEGRILMYGLRVQHRAQTTGTFRLLFNALTTEAARSATQQDGAP